MLRLIALLIQAAAPAEQELPSAAMLAKAPDLSHTSAERTTLDHSSNEASGLAGEGKPAVA